MYCHLFSKLYLGCPSDRTCVDPVRPICSNMWEQQYLGYCGKFDANNAIIVNKIQSIKLSVSIDKKLTS